MEDDLALMEPLEGLHDPLAAPGKPYPLPALLALAIIAMLAGMTRYDSIAQYGKERGRGFVKLLDFRLLLAGQALAGARDRPPVLVGHPPLPPGEKPSEREGHCNTESGN